MRQGANAEIVLQTCAHTRCQRWRLFPLIAGLSYSTEIIANQSLHCIWGADCLLADSSVIWRVE